MTKSVKGSKVFGVKNNGEILQVFLSHEPLVIIVVIP